MLSWPPSVRIFLSAESTDMRKGFDSLASRVESSMTLDPVATPTPENEEMSRERVESQGRFDEVGERVEPLPHVGRLGPEEDLHGRGPAQHGRPSSTART